MYLLSLYMLSYAFLFVYTFSISLYFEFLHPLENEMLHLKRAILSINLNSLFHSARVVNESMQPLIHTVICAS